ncbi:MAG: MFS transporter, partial [Acidimicrobiales bacterium]|nr:MFS transporter [Acidimicrobiales bacterium]
MTASEATEPFDRAALQKRTVATLTGAQVLGGGAVAAAVTVGSLLAKDLTGRDYLAGMATAALTLGAAIAAVPLARQANRNGRRPTLAKALLVGAVGSLVVAVAAQAQVFVLLLVGLMAIGVAQAAGLQIRFAAADLAEDHERARAIGIVVWATTVGAVAAPNLLGPTSALAERLGVDELSGLPALGAVLNLAAGVFVWMRLRPDPLVAAGGLTAADAPKRSLAPAIQAVRAHADAVLALAAVVVAHLTMVAVMSMTSIHLDEGGQSKAFIGFVISIHIAGMYALSPVAGWLADRIGRRLTILAGAGVLVLATDTTGHTHGSESAMMLGALFLLGVGWSLCLV